MLDNEHSPAPTTFDNPASDRVCAHGCDRSVVTPARARTCRARDREKQPWVVSTTQLRALLTGLRWMYDTEQPAHAVGPTTDQVLRFATHRRLRFVPLSFSGRPVIFLESIEDVGPRAGDLCRTPVLRSELEKVSEHLDGMGEEVTEIYVDASGIFGWLALGRPPHPSLADALMRRATNDVQGLYGTDVRSGLSLAGGPQAFVNIGDLHHQAAAQSPDARLLELLHSMYPKLIMRG